MLNFQNVFPSFNVMFMINYIWAVFIAAIEKRWSWKPNSRKLQVAFNEITIRLIHICHVVSHFFTPYSPSS